MKQMFAVTLGAAPSPSRCGRPTRRRNKAIAMSRRCSRAADLRAQQCASSGMRQRDRHRNARVPAQGYVSRQLRTAQPAPAATGERTVGAGTIIGAIIGGVVGHQFGNSSGGRDRGTAAGAIVGGLVGNQIENSAPSTASAQSASGPARVDYVPETRTVQRCRTVYDGRDEIVGYNVAYRYQGRDYTTRMAYDPGPTMNVRVNLAPDVRLQSADRERR